MRNGWLKAGTEPKCPYCFAAIGLDDVNVATDVALCRECKRTTSFAALLESGRGAALVEMPSGCRFDELPEGFRVEASTRSRIAFFYIPFMCFWSGMSLNGIYGDQIRKGRFDLFESLFGLAFVVGSVMLASLCLMSAAGHVSLLVQEDELILFAGIGPVGWRRRLLWSDYDAVRDQVKTSGKGHGSHVLVLEGRKTVSFGLQLSEERRYWMLSVLRRQLLERQRRAGRRGDWG